MLKRKRRIGDHHVECRQSTGGSVAKHRIAQGVAPLDHEVLDPVQEQVHARHSRRGQILLLPVQLAKKCTRIAAPLAHMLYGRQQHAAGATGRVVDRLALVRVKDVDNQPHHTARRIEFARFLVRRIGKLLDQVLVRVAHYVRRHPRIAQRQRREVLDQVLEQLVGQPVLVGPLGVAEHPVQMLLIRRLYAAHGVGKRRAHVLGGAAHGRPMAVVGDLKAMLVGKILAVVDKHCGVLFVPHVANPLEEQQRQDVRLPVGAVDRATAQDVGGLPQVAT